MKTLIKPLLWGILVLSITFSCKSNSDYLKTAALELNKLAEAMSDTKYEAEFDRLVADYNKLMKNRPNSIQEMSEEEVANLEGGSDYLAAMEFYNQVYMGKSRYFAVADYEQPISPNGAVGTYDANEYELPGDNDTETEDNNILIPGVTYITTSSSTATDVLGGKVGLKMEFTIYNDGSATGNLIETNSKDSYGNTNSYEHPVEGTWELVSKHDKRYLKIDLVLESDDYYNRFTYYVNDDLDAYANDLNTKPVKLERKDLAENSNSNNNSPLVKQKKSGQPDTKIAIDLGLPSGLKWATCNVGASEPEEWGDYFAWGETEPYYSNLDPLTWKTGKSGYDWASYQWCNGTKETLTKYNSSSKKGTVDNKNNLEERDDAARANWGGNWRMPTKDEIIELIRECTWKRVTQNGVAGILVIGPNGNSIFLPAAGGIFGDYFDKDHKGYGNFYYWSSSKDSDDLFANEAWSITFNSTKFDYTLFERVGGLPVRPVTK